MCTASWLISKDSYQVFFNRDELKSRLKARRPLKQEKLKVRYLSPIDTDAGGTWIGVNEYGITLCLLNNYSTAAPQETRNYKSRGHIISSVMHLDNVCSVISYLERTDLAYFRPFDLLVFGLLNKPCRLAWNGEKKSFDKQIKMPLTSSSFNTEQVIQSRVNQLRLAESSSEEKLIELHASHYPEKSAHSICMHRDDAGTVSFSHITVSNTLITFEYKDGAPCEAVSKSMVTLNR